MNSKAAVGKSDVEILIVLVLLASVCCDGQSFKEVNGMNCSIHSSSVITFPGWPHIFECTSEDLNSTNFVVDWCESLYDYEDVSDTASVQCLATDLTNSMVINNQTGNCEEIYTGTVRLNGVTQFDSPSLEYCILTMDPSSTVSTPCQCYEVTFERRIEPTTCADSLAANTQVSIPVEATQSHYDIFCPVEGNLLMASQVNVTWFLNCGPLPSRHSIRTDAVFLSKLTLNNIGYDQAGNYTCAVEYNGVTRFFHSSICVKQPESFDATTVNCEQTEIMADDGENVTISCTVSFGTGFPMQQFYVKWFQDETIVCQNLERNTTIPSPTDTGIGCIFFVNNPDALNLVCEPRSEPPEMVTATAQLFLTNINQSDFTSYIITAGSASNVNGSHNVTISQRPSPPPVELIVGLVVGLGVLLIVVVILLVVFRVEIAAYWKIFFGAFEPDILKYHASIFYLAGSVVDNGANALVQGARQTTINHLRDLGFRRCYDQQINLEPGSQQADSVLNVVNQSHRVVIILSHEFINDPQSAGNLYQAIMRMVNEGRKIIFILIPGTIEYIHQRANSARADEIRDRYRMIKRMIELNHAIQWSNEKTLDVRMFKMRLRYAMPKLHSTQGQFDNVVYENGHVAANGGQNRIGISDNHV